MPKVSVIIPCYNQGQYLDESVESVLAQTYDDFEIIVVNDGSTDRQTLEILATFTKPKTKVIHTTNQGLAHARNNGIRAASGQYILPLDADDRIGRTYLEKAVTIMEENDNAGIVYAEVEYFGEVRGKWQLPAYSLNEILFGNVVMCSAVFRKADWQDVGGYRSIVPGWEDYDLWLSIIERGREVVLLPETLFYYRQTSQSMSSPWGRDFLIRSRAQIFRCHQKLYLDNAETFCTRLLELEDSVRTMGSSRLWRMRTNWQKFKQNITIFLTSL
jgi:glycosyltransferase involved in cell wall biosynthesis